ncbi:hypothetical protein [Micromonospora gifhornensis]|uniref:hypothetical protein n=1 Tax=Micromonospora gifhornensis TaxID=84594 RepID=UPI003F509B30
MPNTLLAGRRAQLPSPRRPGQCLSRAELADAVNAALDHLYPSRDLTAYYVDHRWVGKLERGEHRWPSEERRAALRNVLNAATDAELDLYNPRRTPFIGLVVDDQAPRVNRPMRAGDAASGTGLDTNSLTPPDSIRPTVDLHPTENQHEPEPPHADQRPVAVGTPSDWRAWLREAVLGHEQRHIVLSIHQLEGMLRHGNLAYQSAQYSDLHQLPRLISGAESLFAEPPRTGDVTRKARTVSGVYLLASKLAAKLGDGELAWTTADRSRCFALIANDPALTAIAAYQTACALAKQGRPTAAEEVAVTAADTVARHKLHRTPAYLSAYGALLLHAAVAAARGTNPRNAWAHLKAAESAADRLGRNSNELWTAFGPTNVQLHRISVAVALQDNQRAIRTADQVDTSPLPRALTSRRAQVHLDLAAAHSATRDSDPQAMLQLLEYERLAPEAIRLNATATGLITKLLRRERPRHTPGLRALAGRAGVPDS